MAGSCAIYTMLYDTLVEYIAQWMMEGLCFGA